MRGKRIVLIGAGSAQFGIGTVADILISKVLNGSTIVLHDINPNSLEMVRRACQIAIDETKADFSLEATTSRSEALMGADFVIISIEVGDRFKLWEQDFEIPRKYGNRQIYGENGGPGGLFHSLRIIPPMVEICADIEKICPSAWVFNFSNPMSRVCLAVKRKFRSRLKFVGLCHGIYNLVLFLTPMLNTPFANLDIKAGGLNHFGVLLEATYKDTGKDAYPDIRKKAPDYLKNAVKVNFVKQIMRIYGYLPYVTDSHFGEYVNWSWEWVDADGIKRDYEDYKLQCSESKRDLKRIVEGKKYLKTWLKPSGERVIPIIEGIITDSKQYELAANLPNSEGIIENLPRDVVVECPATVDKNGVHGIKLGELPNGIAALMNTQASVQDLSVEAALSGSRELALQALLADPVVDSLSGAEKMLDEILQLQRDHLPLFNGRTK
ncbi:MAG: alpha-glucosidase [Candidatus Atabeyarchaeum deiterrae]